jgi:hypothetical protein
VFRQPIQAFSPCRKAVCFLTENKYYIDYSAWQRFARYNRNTGIGERKENQLFSIKRLTYGGFCVKMLSPLKGALFLCPAEGG